MTPWAYIVGALVTVTGGWLIASPPLGRHRTRERLDKETSIYERLPDGPSKDEMAKYLAKSVDTYVGSPADEELSPAERSKFKATRSADRRWTTVARLVGVFLAVVPLLLVLAAFLFARVEPAGLNGGGCPASPFEGYVSTESGATVQRSPLSSSRTVRVAPAGQQVLLDGWVTSEPRNVAARAPLNTPIWFHLVEGGWISASDLSPSSQSSATPVVLVGAPECVGWYTPPSEA